MARVGVGIRHEGDVHPEVDRWWTVWYPILTCYQLQIAYELTWQMAIQKYRGTNSKFRCSRCIPGSLPTPVHFRQVDRVSSETTRPSHSTSAESGSAEPTSWTQVGTSSTYSGIAQNCAQQRFHRLHCVKRSKKTGRTWCLFLDWRVLSSWPRI